MKFNVRLQHHSAFVFNLADTTKEGNVIYQQGTVVVNVADSKLKPTDSEANIIDNLEQVFVEGNGMGDTERLDHRSISIGDVIEYPGLGDYFVSAMGFEKM